MRKLEFDATLASDSSFKVPAAIAAQIPKDGSVHVIVVLPSHEDSEWERLTAEQFLAGYDEADAIYDSI